MDSSKFNKELKKYLVEGGINAVEVDDTIRYYENYFIEKCNEGRSEIDVLNELGDPRLIAKTIIETSGISEHRKEKKYKGEEQYTFNDRYESNYSSGEHQYGAQAGTKVFTIKNKFISALLLIGIIILLIGVFIFAIKILYLLLPFIFIYGLIRYLLK